MNISFSWLKRYLKTDLEAERIAEILTELGLEVEEFEKIETIKGGLKGVVVGEVLTCEEHPDSDHLHITSVDVGAEAPLQIVCGAANCRKGLKVMCATVGSVLYPIDSEEEFKMLSKAREIIREARQIPCTACRYCTEGCPKSIPIPEAFAAYNKYLAAKITRRDAKALIPTTPPLSDCIKCGRCEELCPQGIEIRARLEEILK